MLYWIFASTYTTGRTGNITLISMTFDTEDPVTGAMDMTYDVIIRNIKRKNPEVFGNFSHISLRCVGDAEKDLEASSRSLPRILLNGVEKLIWSADHADVIITEDEVASCFLKFFYLFQHLFIPDLSRQFTIVTTTSNVM